VARAANAGCARVGATARVTASSCCGLGAGGDAGALGAVVGGVLGALLAETGTVLAGGAPVGLDGAGA
jgi:hypothetical protein